MKTPTAPFEEREKYYGYKIALMFFEQASAALEEIKRIPCDPHNQLLPALWAAFAVSYTKPFRQTGWYSKEPGFYISEDLVPPELKDTHASIILFRNKHYAHTDKAFRNDNSTTQNNIVFKVEADGTIRMGFGGRVFTDSGIIKLEALLAHLKAKLSWRTKRIWAKWTRKVNFAPNTMWKLNHAPGISEVLLQIEKKG